MNSAHHTLQLFFACNQNFTDIEKAKWHFKSFKHEVVESIQGAGKDGKSLLI
jgi:hypothetical protein